MYRLHSSIIIISEKNEKRKSIEYSAHTIIPHLNRSKLICTFFHTIYSMPMVELVLL